MKVKITKQMAKKILALNKLMSDNCSRNQTCAECPLKDKPVCNVFTGCMVCLNKKIKPKDLVGEYEIMEDKKNENNK